MPELIPVDHDPFADASGGGQSAPAAKLIPVDHDPFASGDQHASAGAQEQHRTLADKLADTWPAQLAKTVYNAVTGPGDAATGNANVTPSQPGQWSDEDEARLQLTNAALVDRTRDLAAIATPQSAATRAGVGPLGVPVKSAAPKTVTVVRTAPDIEALKDAASAGYKSPEVAGLELHPRSMVNLSDRINQELNAIGVDENLAPKTFAIIGKAGKVPEGATSVTGKNFESLRRTLGTAAKSTDPTERLAARSAIDHLHDYFSDVPKADVISGDPEKFATTIQEANANYAAAKRAETIKEAMENARNNAGAANSGQNVDNAFRQQIRAILNSPAKRRGFSAEELDQMRTIVRGTKAGDASRFLGNLLGGGGGLGSVVVASAGGAATGGPGALLPLAGYAFKKLGSHLTESQINKLDEMIRSRAPAAEKVTKPLNDWGTIAQQFEVAPTTRNIGRLALASADLSQSLRAVGVNIAPQALTNSVRSQGTGEPQKPVQLDIPEDVNHGAENTQEPSPAQSEAGNSKMRHVTWRGLDISISHEAGHERTGTSADGTPWSTTMQVPYGYIKGTTGGDKEPIDVLIGPHPHSQRAFVFDQIRPDGRFDEHKIILGASNVDQARAIYDSAFSDGQGPQRRAAVKEMTPGSLKQWLEKSDTKKPVAYEEPASVREQRRRARSTFSIRPTLKQLLADERPVDKIRSDLALGGHLTNQVA